MRPTVVRTWLVAAVAAMAATLSPTIAGDAAAAEPPPGPALKTPATTLQAALTCTSDLATATKTPILLVPGTIETPLTAYSWGYQKVLRAQGYPICTVTLPGGGTQDMQITVEYVVHAIRYMNSTAGRKVSILGHSQGGLLPAWAVRYWPDLAGMIDDVVSLDAPYGGSSIADLACGAINCPPLGWQVNRNSDWSRALRRYNIPAGLSYTSLGSTIDDFVKPGPDATRLPGATNIEIQDLCPNRTVRHMDFLWDAPTYALVMDALTNAGTASPTRVGTSSCSASRFPGVDASSMEVHLMLIGDIIDEILDAPWVSTEPRLRDYAIGTLGDTNIALNRPVTTSSNQSSSYVGAKAVDGSYSTRWASEWWADPSWLYVDLGSTKQVNGVQVSWEDAYAEDYDILYYNGTSWVSAFHTSNGQGTHEFIPLNSINTRYIAIQGNERATNYGYSMYEFTVAGH